MFSTMRIAHPWVPIEVLAIEGEQVQADLFFLTDMPLNISDLNAKIGLSAVGSNVPGANGLKFVFQEHLSEQLYKDLSSDRNMSWIRPDSWFTYLSLDAPEKQIYYDLGVSNAGVIRLAPYGTPPMDIIEGSRAKELPSWVPTLPLNTPQWVGGSLIVVLAILPGIVLIRRTRKGQARSTSSLIF